MQWLVLLQPLFDVHALICEPCALPPRLSQETSKAHKSNPRSDIRDVWLSLLQLPCWYKLPAPLSLCAVWMVVIFLIL